MELKKEQIMIILTRQNGSLFAINDDLIQTIEAHPDTTIKMTDGKVYIVSESVEEVIDKIVEFRRGCFKNILSHMGNTVDSDKETE